MVSRVILALVTILLAAPVARAQDIKSADLVKQLTQLLQQKKIDAVAAPDAPNSETFHAALYFPGTQLILVSAKYAAPALLTELLARKDYKGVYAELASASVQGSKVMISDIYADGLVVKPSGSNPPDSVEMAATLTNFDGAWKKAKMTEADYLKIFSAADASYAHALQGLINQLKGSGT